MRKLRNNLNGTVDPTRRLGIREPRAKAQLRQTLKRLPQFELGRRGKEKKEEGEEREKKRGEAESKGT